MHPYRPHNDVRNDIAIACKRLRARPHMMGQIRSATCLVVCVEKGEWIYQRCCCCDRYEEQDNGMARRSISILRESESQRMLRIKDWWFCSSVKYELGLEAGDIRL
jgi:hypothetical protein